MTLLDLGIFKRLKQNRRMNRLLPSAFAIY